MARSRSNQLTYARRQVGARPAHSTVNSTAIQSDCRRLSTPSSVRAPRVLTSTGILSQVPSETRRQTEAARCPHDVIRRPSRPGSNRTSIYSFGDHCSTIELRTYSIGQIGLQSRAIATVGAAGFEPAASASRTPRATKLRHAPEPSVGAEPTASSLPRTRSTAELTRQMASPASRLTAIIQLTDSPYVSDLSARDCSHMPPNC